MRQTVVRRAGFFGGLCAIVLTAGACGSDATGNDAASQKSSATAVSAAAAEGSRAATESVGETAAGQPSPVRITVERDDVVTLNGPIAAKYASATDSQKDVLGLPLTGDRNAGTRESGVVFQQFRGGVIIAKNDKSGTPAYIITSGTIRDAWNTERAPDGTPSITGMNGSPGPLGVPTSDVTSDGDVNEASFEHGSISENTRTGEVTVTVNGKIVPSGLT
ncbi:LGFP repeat-containing protein [Gordonia sp. OPL2]|uniref:LGFP repeat-containing protein n=1 Tax=Gordonia sp. OPL2 TaxID=2486274 RepID=UPI001655DBAE|nr:hypothetical protein [Gordonia sp. OPL2]RPA19886.1 hypothetical protein EEB19_02255 [Gordonia sp. OPL2]